MPEPEGRATTADAISTLVETLRAVKLMHPELRMGQIISNAVSDADVPVDVFYIEDDALLIGLQDQYFGRGY